MHGKLIEQIGYHCRDYFLAQWDRFKGLSGRHPRALDARERPGDVRRRSRIETPRIRVTLATGILRERCERINLGYRNPDDIDPGDWPAGTDNGSLLVPRAGELLFRVRPPAEAGRTR